MPKGLFHARSRYYYAFIDDGPAPEGAVAATNVESEESPPWKNPFGK
jgi:hypothetical protein